MSWVRRTETPTPAHTCEPPMREVTYTLPMPPRPSSGKALVTLAGKPYVPAKWHETVPAGKRGDLWRCDDDTCGRLWWVGNGCDDCDAAGRTGGRCVRGGYHSLSFAWRPATWWQRFRNRGNR